MEMKDAGIIVLIIGIMVAAVGVYLYMQAATQPIPEKPSDVGFMNSFWGKLKNVYVCMAIFIAGCLLAVLGLSMLLESAWGMIISVILLVLDILAILYLIFRT